MRHVIPIAILLLALGAGVLVFSGVQDWIARNAMTWQRDAQNALAGALRALRSGEPGAVIGFLVICFTHGFLHALGPGHGKAVIAAYAAASGATLRRMIRVASMASMAQTTIAVVLVYSVVWVLAGARDRVEDLAGLIEPMSFAVIALLGLMLVWRGLRRFSTLVWRAEHNHVHSEDCACGQSHVPAVVDIAQAGNWREMAALVMGIALRPCTSALFLLILTWRLDLDGIGILGVYVMGMGTMTVTASAALVAHLFRSGMLLVLPDGRVMLPIVVMIELVVGAAIAVLFGSMLLGRM